MTSPNKDDNLAFTHAEAVQIILAGINTGAIKFPFTGSFSKEKAEEMLKGTLCQARSGERTEERFREDVGYALSYEFANLARKDAIYLLSLLQTLVVGLTKEEAEGITARAFR
ncbi:hypothetical protein [uncultured Duodenibacillus sp.]|uniref:hypothetical protein n=1 Tax=uncultured Duodenibacillus sp. TaxID=1980699 RepID=UPI00258C33B9|nr:hypothetical protein [uncultured Duodenibacillus sp.]